MGKLPFTQRFWSKIQQPLEFKKCWEWISTKNKHGYGVIKHGDRMKLAHRISYMILRGEIPEGKELDHLCRNPSCVNPFHLEAVTHKENVLRGVSFMAENAKKTHCPKGHPLEGDNLSKWQLVKGWRRCRTCWNEYIHDYYTKHPEKLVVKYEQVKRWKVANSA